MANQQYKPCLNFERTEKQQKLVDAIIATDKFIVEDHGIAFGFCLKNSHSYYWVSFSIIGTVNATEIYSQATGKSRRGMKTRFEIKEFIERHTGINIWLS